MARNEYLYCTRVSGCKEAGIHVQRRYESDGSWGGAADCGKHDTVVPVTVEPTVPRSRYDTVRNALQALVDYNTDQGESSEDLGYARAVLDLTAEDAA